MDGIKVAWCSWLAAQRFLFWTLVEATTRAIYWHKEASRELLILKPRRPKDLYEAGYVLFAWDIQSDAWRGYWRGPNTTPGMPADEMFEIQAQLWGNVPFHEVEFSDMPHITFKVRAVSLVWCRTQCAKPSETFMPPEIAVPMPVGAVKVAPEERAPEEITMAEVEKMDEKKVLH